VFCPAFCLSALLSICHFILFQNCWTGDGTIVSTPGIRRILAMASLPGQTPTTTLSPGSETQAVRAFFAPAKCR